MMMAGIGSALGSGLSLFGGLEGMFGGGQSSAFGSSVPSNEGSVQLPPMQPINTGGIQSYLNGTIPGLNNYNLGGQNLGQYQGALQSTINNPFASPAIQGAQTFGNQAGANAWNIGSTVPGSIGAAGQIMNTAFDPQNALYGRTAHNVSEQSLAGLEGSGIASTPWGQGVYGNTMSNFNIDWQNQQLGRQTQGAAGAEGLLTNAGQNASGAFNLGSMGAAAPYSMYNTIGGQNLSYLTGGANYGNTAASLPQQGIGDWLQYLSGANQANTVANQTAGLGLQQQSDISNFGLKQQQQGFAQNQTYGREIGAGLSGLSGQFKPGGAFNFGSPGQFGWG